MKFIPPALKRFVCVLALLFPLPADAQVVTSPVVGFSALDVVPGGDMVLTVGFNDRPAFVGAISSASQPVSGIANFYFQAGAFDSLSQLPETYYLKILSGASNGLVFAIESSSASSVVVELESLSRSGINSGTRVALMPYRTLDSLFPPTDQPASQLSSGNLPPARKMELLLFEDGVGSGLSPSRIFFLTSDGWIESKAGFPDAGDLQVPPHAVFVLRTKAGDPSWRLVMSGEVSYENAYIPLRTNTDGPQDNIIGVGRPVAIVLNDLGLESVFEESASNDAADRGDELLVMDNSDTTQNREPVATYFRSGGEWRLDGPGFPESGSELVPAGAGLIVRKVASAEGETVYWQNQPNYP